MDSPITVKKRKKKEGWYRAIALLRYHLFVLKEMIK